MKLSVKIILSLLVLVLGFAFVRFYSQVDAAPEYDGTIQFILVDEQGNETINEELYFNEGDTLLDVLQDNYTVVCANATYKPDTTCSYESSFGYTVLEINDVKSNWTNSYLAIYINDTYATLGFSKLTYKQDDVIKVVWTSLK